MNTARHRDGYDDLARRDKFLTGVVVLSVGDLRMKTKYVEGGIHYGYRTYQAGFQSHEFFAAITRKAPKTYGKHTAFSQRTVLKRIGQTEIGKFPTKQDAVWAAKQWLQMRFGGAA